MWGQICLVWFSSKKKLRMDNVHGVSDNFLSKRSKFWRLKNRGLLKTYCIKLKKKKKLNKLNKLDEGLLFSKKLATFLGFCLEFFGCKT